MIPPGMVR
jgi:hypothetical protein